MIKIGLIIFLFFLELSVFSQSEKTPVSANQPNSLAKDFETFKDRLYFGGNFGGVFGSTTYVTLSPFIGCKLTKDFSVGGGITYNYYSQTYGAKKYTSYIYGTNAFARYTILENLFAQVGWDRLNISDYTSPILNSRVWIDNILVGGGYKQAISDRSYFSAAIFYNINQTPLSPYPNPIFQVGINVGF